MKPFLASLCHDLRDPTKLTKSVIMAYGLAWVLSAPRRVLRLRRV